MYFSFLFSLFIKSKLASEKDKKKELSLINYFIAFDGIKYKKECICLPELINDSKFKKIKLK